MQKTKVTDKEIKIKCESNTNFEIDDLIPFQGKLKSITKENFTKLKKSIVKDGLPLGFHVWKNNDKIFLIDGHHRHLALKSLREEGYFVAPVPCNIVLAKNKKEAAKSILISNSKYADMNDESLSDFMIDQELALDDLEFLDLIDLDMNDYFEDQLGLTEEEKAYTDKIKAPIYEPKGEKPEINKLFDLSKTKELLEKIKASSLKKEEKEFLTFAAYRHIAFNYESIAEYYCHLEKDHQELLEDSALVIIDFNKAIENGFVELTKDLAEQFND
jgi:ParB-like chromosome segregation protein Spo0J